MVPNDAHQTFPPQQLITKYYNMLSVPCPPVSVEFESLPLTTALRMSMADEVDDIPRGTEAVQPPGVDGMTLTVPEDLPVDLRGKLAVCLIRTDQEPPEVCGCSRVCKFSEGVCGGHASLNRC